MKARQIRLILTGTLILVLAGALALLYWPVPPGNLYYEIRACGGAGELRNNSLTLDTRNGTLGFSQVLNTYCNANMGNLKVAYALEGYSLQLTGVFSADTVTHCICPLEINGKIAGLENGTYGITFVFDNRYGNQREVVGTSEFRIG